MVYHLGLKVGGGLVTVKRFQGGCSESRVLVFRASRENLCAQHLGILGLGV